MSAAGAASWIWGGVQQIPLHPCSRPFRGLHELGDRWPLRSLRGLKELYEQIRYIYVVSRREVKTKTETVRQVGKVNNQKGKTGKQRNEQVGKLRNVRNMRNVK